jgi:hypothetical protein
MFASLVRPVRISSPMTSMAAVGFAIFIPLENLTFELTGRSRLSNRGPLAFLAQPQ